MEPVSSNSQVDLYSLTGLAGPVDIVRRNDPVERIPSSDEEKNSEQTYNYKRQESTQQDLNDYYSKLAASNYIPADYSSADPLTTASSGLKQAETNLQNAMIDAIQQGMSIEHACNIRCAKAAYEANLMTLKSTIEISI